MTSLSMPAGRYIFPNFSLLLSAFMSAKWLHVFFRCRHADADCLNICLVFISGSKEGEFGSNLV